MILALMPCCACAEEAADYTAILEFAEDYGVQDEIRQLIDGALSGDLSLKEFFSGWLQKQLRRPVETVLPIAAGMLAPVLLLALLGSILPEGRGACMDAGFLLRLILMLLSSRLAIAAIAEAEACLQSVKHFTDISAPALAAVLAAMGMEGSAALVSPAAALAGNAAQQLFLKYGLPLCRIALCTSIAGNLSREIDLSRFTALFRKGANWLAGLATTLFTALLALQGSVSEGLDGVAVRTAKFAVDSASPVIGSGVSDAWESYISGVMISKNALGVSSIAVLLLACAGPVLLCIAALTVLTLLSALLELFGEKLSARAAGQISGVCQMALSLCTGAIAIATILLGAVMSLGRGLF